MQKRRFIAHVDMDAFFAAIEQRDNPRLKGKPVVVGADPKGGAGRGVVSTCSYEARKFGIHSAMPISIAYRKCPRAVFLPVDMEKYAKVSHQIYDIFYDFTPDIEPVSIDEAFLDITGSHHLFGQSVPLRDDDEQSRRGKPRRSAGSPSDVCLLIKSRIKQLTDLIASVGLAPTKMAAKIASDLEKPDGFVEVKEDKLLDFLWPLDISRMWGLGKKTEVIFRGMGMNKIGDIAKKDIRELTDVFGKNGARFWYLANGIDERPVETDDEIKSVGHETTFNEDTSDRTKIEAALMRLSEKVSDRLRQNNLKGRTIALKIRLENFKTYTRALTMDVPTNFADVLYKQVKNRYNEFAVKAGRVRLVGVSVSNLSSADFRGNLFAAESDRNRESVHRALDKIKERFGDESIHRATSAY